MSLATHKKKLMGSFGSFSRREGKFLKRKGGLGACSPMLGNRTFHKSNVLRRRVG